MATPEEMEATMVANLKEKTGRTLEAWIDLAQKAGLEKHGQIVKHLKEEHGLTHGYANLVAHRLLTPVAGAPAADDLVAVQYAGAKAGLKPIYDALQAMVQQFGADVEIAPKKAYVSLRRTRQFALIQPSTSNRVDLGLNLKGVSAGDRLEASGSFNSMCSHRVRLSSPKDVDAEVRTWLRTAYDDA